MTPLLWPCLLLPEVTRAPLFELCWMLPPIYYLPYIMALEDLILVSLVLVLRWLL